MGAYGPSSVTPAKNILLPVEDWDSEVFYTELTLVIHQGGFWRAAADNEDSEPISGNTDWTLVAGTPYVDVVLTPPELVTLPFYDPTTIGPGVVAIPSPGPGFAALVLYATSVVSPGDAWGSNARPNLYYTDFIARTTQPLLTEIDDELSGDLTSSEPLMAALVDGSNSTFSFAVPGGAVDQPVVIATGTDVTNGGTFGTRSVTYRLYYSIVPATIPAASTFFTITAVNTSAKRFFVHGDATGDVLTTCSVTGSTNNDGDYVVASTTLLALETDAITGAAHLTKTITIAGNHAAAYPAGSLATITGSTGNDGVYTVVSATFTVSTAIVVAEALPDATDTADGDIGHAEETMVTVTGAIASSTGNGWIEVS